MTHINYLRLNMLIKIPFRQKKEREILTNLIFSVTHCENSIWWSRNDLKIGTQSHRKSHTQTALKLSSKNYQINK